MFISVILIKFACQKLIKEHKLSMALCSVADVLNRTLGFLLACLVNLLWKDSSIGVCGAGIFTLSFHNCIDSVIVISPAALVQGVSVSSVLCLMSLVLCGH